MRKNRGSSFDDFLSEEGILEEVESLAIKRLVAHELSKTMRKKKITKRVLAARMRTSRSQVDRLLDPQNSSVTLATLARSASVLGLKIRVSLQARRAA